MTDARAPTNIGWHTTAPHPWKRSHTHGADQGQTGWKLHAVPVNAEGKPLNKHTNAICGTWPRHGWGLDAFIDAKCARCVATIAKLEALGDTFVDLPEALAAARTEALNAGINAAYDGKARSDNPHPAYSQLRVEWLRGFNQERPEQDAPTTPEKP